MPDLSFCLNLVVGLGNPGAEYERTRHNIGFMAIDSLAARWGMKLASERRFHGIYGEGQMARGAKLRLLKPTTYMNLSGQAVQACCNWYKLSPQSVLVIYDDMDLPLGKMRLRMSGSAGGHNGMKSIITHLGTQEFPRLRIGIGRAGLDNAQHADLATAKSPAIKHVLGSFNTAETAILPELLQLTQDVIVSITKEGMEKAMSLYNSRSVSMQSS